VVEHLLEKGADPTIAFEFLDSKNYPVFEYIYEKTCLDKGKIASSA
jgi:hypothetical protein